MEFQYINSLRIERDGIGYINTGKEYAVRYGLICAECGRDNTGGYATAWIPAAEFYCNECIEAIQDGVHYYYDRYGRYTILTGKERSGFCFWCGKVSGIKRYCCKECSHKYNSWFNWNYCAGGSVCEKCGKKTAHIERHHIEPLRGRDRGWNFLNNPHNLIDLCHECHKEAHRELNIKALERKIVEIENKIKSKQAQFELF